MLQWLVIGWMVSLPLYRLFLHYSVRGPDHRSHTCSLQHTRFHHTTLLQLNCYTSGICFLLFYGSGVQLRHCWGRQIAQKCQFVRNVALILLQTPHTFTSMYFIGCVLYRHFEQTVSYHIYITCFKTWLLWPGGGGDGGGWSHMREGLQSHRPQCRDCISTIASVKWLEVLF